MMKLALKLLPIFILCNIACQTQASEKKVVCYHTNWSQYRPDGGKFFPENIDPNLCTHIIYSFAKLTGTSLQPYEWNDEGTEWSRGMFQRTMELKKANSNLKILLAVGGWNHGSASFSQMVNNPSSRKEFIKSSVDFLKKNNFDGLDLDWEYPANREGSQPSDKERFTDLCKELKEEYSKHGLLVTAAVAAGKKTIDTAYEVDKISQHLDFINLMAYDLHGAWETFTGHNAPLYKRSTEVDTQAELNVDFAVKYWLSKGTPNEKLILGMPTYGRGFRLNDANKKLLGDGANGPATQGSFTRENGYNSYYEICQKLSQGWQRQWNDEQKVPFITNGNEWFGYDDVESLKEKTNYAKQNNLGGVMFWALDLDDFDGKFCNQGKYPLINSVKANFLNGVQPQVQTTQKSDPPSSTALTPSSGSDSNTTPSSGGNDGDSTPSSDTTPSSQTDNNDCSKGDGFYAIKSSGCKKYYQCVYSNTQYEMKVNYDCTPGTLFDTKLSICNWADQVIC